MDRKAIEQEIVLQQQLLARTNDETTRNIISLKISDLLKIYLHLAKEENTMLALQNSN